MFEKAPIPRAVATMAIPSMITMVISLVYNMADTFFIGQTGEPIQVTAISLAMPVFSFFTAIAGLFGLGGNSSISRSLGEGKKGRAKNISSFCFYSVAILGVLSSILLFLFMDPILDVLGVGETTYEFTRSYMNYIAIGVPFIMLSNCCANLIRGEGAATTSMIGNMIGTITNIILDPVFILVLGFGVSGAGIATLIGNVLASVFYIVYLLSRRTQLSINPKLYRANDKIATGVISIGFPNALNSLLMSAAQIVLNTSFTQYGDIPLAAMNVALRVNQLITFLSMGLCQGIMPLLGYNYGAKNKKRMVRILYFSGACAIGIGTILTILTVTFRAPLVALFIDDEEVIYYGVRYVAALSVSGPLVGLFFLSESALQGMGKATYTLILTIVRQVLVYIPSIILLNHFFGVYGLCFSQPVADYFAITAGMIMTVSAIRKFKPEEKPA